MQARPPGDASPHAGRQKRWRPWVLAGVYLLGAVHWLHWKYAGTTLAPAELNEAQYTLEHSIVTVGFILLAAAMLATIVFGRFFCGWGCHVLAMQDSAAWLLRRVGFTPKPVRLRLAQLLPLFAMGTMFLWPQIERAMDAGHEPAPPLRVTADSEGFGSLVTADFSRNLPGPWMSITTFVVCAGVATWLLGTRSFCTYVCPYGAIFSLADRASPTRVRLKVLNGGHGDASADCSNCGLCTAACPSHIRVHEELMDFGRVVNPACLRDYHCVAACPDAKLDIGAARPAGFLSWRKWGRFGVPYDLSWREELVAASVGVCSLLILRGLYDAVPFFLAMALAVILSYAAVVTMRVGGRRAVSFAGWTMSRDGAMTHAGRVFSVAAVVACAALLQSAAVRAHSWLGMEAFEQAADSPAECARAQWHLEWVEEWSVVHTDAVDRRLALLAIDRGDAAGARPRVERIIARGVSPQEAESWRDSLVANPRSTPGYR